MMENEWLLIRVESLDRWRAPIPDPKSCAAHLKPRASEDRKSAWAHVPDNWNRHPHRTLNRVANIARTLKLPRAPTNWILGRFSLTPSRRLQALCVLLHYANRNDSAPAPLINYVSFKREAGGRIHDIPADHVVEAYDPTHRELETKDEGVRLEVSKRIVDGQFRHFLPRCYTLAELKPLLKRLLDTGLLRDEFVATAKRLLAETSG